MFLIVVVSCWLNSLGTESDGLAMTTQDEVQPLPWDAEMDRDLGLDGSDMPDVRRVVQRD